MAWTSSAGPRGGFAPAVWATAVASLVATTTSRRSFDHRRALALVIVGVAHLVMLMVVMPRLTGDHAVVLAALGFSLVISALFIWQITPFHWQAMADEAAAPVRPAEGTCEGGGERAAAERQMDKELPLAASPRGHGDHSNGDSAIVSQQTHYDLMARVSHELRTPLNAVVGFSDLMGHELFGPLGHPRYEEYVRHIRDSGRQLLKSAEDTLAIASLLTRAETTQGHDIVSCSDIACEALDIVAVEAATRSIRIESKFDDDLSVLVDRRTLRQIVVNLLAEALARSADHGRIELAARAADDKVIMTVAIDDCRGTASEAHASLPICLARTLIEFCGGQLIESRNRPGAWQAATLLERAVQQDFFLPGPGLEFAARSSP